MSIKNLFIKSFIIVSILCFQATGAFAQFYTSEKPLFIVISTDWCFACKILKPVVEALKEEFASQIEFIELDPTNETNKQFTDQIVSDYGIEEFYNKNKNAFPTVGILSPTGEVKELFVGARSKETYLTVINDLLGIKIAKKEEQEPPVQEISPEEDIQGGRPEEKETSPRPKEADFLERPEELASLGRPPELTFWNLGQAIPYSAYFSYYVLPSCTGNSVVCASGGIIKGTKSNNDKPIFKPWNTGTRDEKGLQIKK